MWSKILINSALKLSASMIELPKQALINLYEKMRKPDPGKQAPNSNVQPSVLLWLLLVGPKLPRTLHRIHRGTELPLIQDLSHKYRLIHRYLSFDSTEFKMSGTPSGKACEACRRVKKKVSLLLKLPTGALRV